MRTAFKGKRVFLTGHTGFKGSWLAIWLHRLGAQVTGYSLAPPTDPSNYSRARVSELVSHEHIADVRDSATLTQALKACDPDFVFHLAAQPLVRESYASPLETYDINVMGTVRVLDAVRTLGLRPAVLCITTDKCYENHEWPWGYRENDPMGGHDPYSSSKGAAEIAIAGYRQSFFDPDAIDRHGVRLASVRAGNVIGGGDWAASRIVPDVVRAMAAGQPVEVRSPAAIRPWQHVLEPLGGYLELAAQMADPKTAGPWCEAWNFGPRIGDEWPVGKLVDTLLTAWGSGSWKDTSDPNQPHEAHTLRLSIDKAVSQLGWQPRLSVEEAVLKTAHWYRSFLDGACARSLCLADIEAYEASGAAAR